MMWSSVGVREPDIHIDARVGVGLWWPGKREEASAVVPYILRRAFSRERVDLRYDNMRGEVEGEEVVSG